MQKLFASLFTGGLYVPYKCSAKFLIVCKICLHKCKVIGKWLIPWSGVLPENLPGPQLVKQVPLIDCTGSFITAFTSACPCPERDNPVNASPSDFLKIHFAVILPSIPMSSKWLLSLGSPHQNHVCTSPVSHMWLMVDPSHSS